MYRVEVIFSQPDLFAEGKKINRELADSRILIVGSENVPSERASARARRGGPALGCDNFARVLKCALI